MSDSVLMTYVLVGLFFSYSILISSKKIIKDILLNTNILSLILILSGIGVSLYPFMRYPIIILIMQIDKFILIALLGISILLTIRKCRKNRCN
jgi:hypothetical protein